MRTGLNCLDHLVATEFSLDHWDMRTGRNVGETLVVWPDSLDHWDMRTGRNACALGCADSAESRSLGYAHWPEQGR